MARSPTSEHAPPIRLRRQRESSPKTWLVGGQERRVEAIFGCWTLWNHDDIRIPKEGRVGWPIVVAQCVVISSRRNSPARGIALHGVGKGVDHIQGHDLVGR